jgi:hypothetical protein
MPSPLATELAVLASAYELKRPEVEDDALRVQLWNGSEADLLAYMQKRHGWTVASEYAPNYVADLRQTLHSFSRNGISH